MRSRHLLTAGMALVLVSCGGGDDAGAEDTAPSTTTTTVAETTTTAAVAGVQLAETSLGEVLVGPEGMTLYGFTVDDPGTSNCYDDCAQVWPPLSGDTSIGDGLDGSIFTTTARDDGTEQLVIGDWPLYYFAGDAAPGDVNGQGVEDIWFVVSAEGELIGADEDMESQAAATPAGDPLYGEGDAPKGIDVAETDLGPALVDGDGFTLYGFTRDTATASACTGACADNWPPVPGEAEISGNVDATLISEITREDGSTQLVYGDWPLYRFAGDSGPGGLNGQGVNDVWFAIGPDATLYR